MLIDKTKSFVCAHAYSMLAILQIRNVKAEPCPEWQRAGELCLDVANCQSRSSERGPTLSELTWPPVTRSLLSVRPGNAEKHLCCHVVILAALLYRMARGSFWPARGRSMASFLLTPFRSSLSSPFLASLFRVVQQQLPSRIVKELSSSDFNFDSSTEVNFVKPFF